MFTFIINNGRFGNQCRAWFKYMQVKYMQDHQDQEFFRCSGVEWNLCWNIENKCEEWFVFSDDVITLSMKNNMLTGATSGKLVIAVGWS
jgi:hypothetical protein